MKRLSAVTLADPTLERVRQEHAAAIRELQLAPAAEMRVLLSVALADGVDTPVPHGLGRAPLWVRESTVRGGVTAGFVEEIRTGSADRAKYVVLRATGYGATITVDLAVL